jgi:hypothetical protein
MKRLLLLLGVAALLVAAPAMAQYVWLDASGDGVCTAADVLSSSTTSVDIYFDPNHDANGTVVTCPQDAGSPMDMISYEFILHASGAGTVTYGTYTDNAHNVVPGGFATPFGETKGGADYHNGYGGNNTTVWPGGPIKVGTLQIAVTGSPVLSFAESTPLSAVFYTAFGSECFGVDFDDTIKLGTPAEVAAGTRDFSDNCGSSTSTPVRATTWGAIKSMYNK